MSNELNGIPVEILLVEDNTADVRFTQEVLSESRISNKLNVVGDGEDALNYLRRRGKYAQVALPDIILLDLKLPKKSGQDVLAEIKRDENLRHIPVAVLTTSQAEEDIVKSYNLDADCYMKKPMKGEDFIELVRLFDQFRWLIVKTPSAGPEK
jgi:CheY-like chemotaxis protein